MPSNGEIQALKALRDGLICSGEFEEAVLEVAESVKGLLADPLNRRVLEYLVRPDWINVFKVTWEGDNGESKSTTGYRVQYCNVRGPYKGGLRFQPGLTLSSVMFLGFEQIFKNALTGLPLGGGKGGADIDLSSMSTAERRRFCTSFGRTFSRVVGEEIDVPAGDIGVGSIELAQIWSGIRSANPRADWGTITGKPLSLHGCPCREEATGYGLMYIVASLTKLMRSEDVAGKSAIISGAGNVSIFAAEKCLHLGVTVKALSNQSGAYVFPGGLTHEILAQFKQLMYARLETKSKLQDEVLAGSWEGVKAFPGKSLWSPEILQNINGLINIALPCAVQNEVDPLCVSELLSKGVNMLAEGANMPCPPETINALKNGGIVYVPGKAANAGGVACSGIEMQMNAGKTLFLKSTVDGELQKIMTNIASQIVALDATDLQHAANQVSFLMLKQSLVDGGIVF